VKKDCRAARRRHLCTQCGSIEHSTEECYHEVEWELPQLMKTAQGLPQLTLLEKVALMRKAEWTPSVCNVCWVRNPGHREAECPRREMCWTCRGTGPYGYLNRHVCKLWADEPEVWMKSRIQDAMDDDDMDYDDVYQGRD
jgi:hypothetical protein